MRVRLRAYLYGPLHQFLDIAHARCYDASTLEGDGYMTLDRFLLENAIILADAHDAVAEIDEEGNTQVYIAGQTLSDAEEIFFLSLEQLKEIALRLESCGFDLGKE